MLTKFRLGIRLFVLEFSWLLRIHALFTLHVIPVTDRGDKEYFSCLADIQSSYKRHLSCNHLYKSEQHIYIPQIYYNQRFLSIITDVYLIKRDMTKCIQRTMSPLMVFLWTLSTLLRVSEYTNITYILKYYIRMANRVGREHGYFAILNQARRYTSPILQKDNNVSIIGIKTYKNPECSLCEHFIVRKNGIY